VDLTQACPNIVKVHAQLSEKDVPFDVAEISCTSTKVHALHLVIIQCGYKHFLTSNFADGNSIPCIPTLSIPVTETIVKAQGGL